MEKPLVQMDDQTITIGEREKPITYLQELKAMTQPIIFTKPLSHNWKGPNTICWCERVLENENDICKTCQQKS